nr:DUF599 family protein [Marinicella sp. W31]MDC2876617.1 DUF599 family protein [Marinicella sp. W31]
MIRRTSLTGAMLIHRKRWMQTALMRDLRMIDTQILSGLQNGTAFSLRPRYSPLAVASR